MQWVYFCGFRPGGRDRTAGPGFVTPKYAFPSLLMLWRPLGMTGMTPRVIERPTLIAHPLGLPSIGVRHEQAGHTYTSRLGNSWARDQPGPGACPARRQG